MKVCNDLAMASGAGDCSILVLLEQCNFSAAVDTADYKSLLNRLKAGIAGSALGWLLSYLSDRTFYVRLPVGFHKAQS